MRTKYKILYIFLLIIICTSGTSCGVEPNIIKDNLDGIWKVFIGGEYSTNSKEIVMKFLDSAIVYDKDTLFFISKNNDRHIIATSDTTKNIIKSLDCKLTYDNDRIIGYEITKSFGDSIATYFYAQRIHNLPEPDTNKINNSPMNSN